MRPCIKLAAQVAKEKIKEYYQITDAFIYVISTSKINYIFIAKHSYLIFINIYILASNKSIFQILIL
jgi:hypothetical protein